MQLDQIDFSALTASDALVFQVVLLVVLGTPAILGIVYLCRLVRARTDQPAGLQLPKAPEWFAEFPYSLGRLSRVIGASRAPVAAQETEASRELTRQGHP